ncbi:MAG TPA: hypothetical protein VGI39_19695 [Polyangiaceae bacterium]
MTTKVTYRIVKTEDGYLARSDELGVESVGASESAALAALRSAIVQSLTSVEAVAPPSRPPPPPRVDLIRAPETDAEPQGPGDSPAADSPAR